MTDHNLQDVGNTMPDSPIEQKFTHMSIDSPHVKEDSIPSQSTINQPSLLLTLPPELRACIYSQLLPTGEVLEFDHTWFYDIENKSGVAMVTSYSTEDAPGIGNLAPLISINHLIRQEVIDHYYGRNTFVLAENNQETHLERWLRRKAPAAFRSMKRVMIEHWRTCDAEPRSGKDECLRRVLVDLETLKMRAVRDAGGHEGEWTCEACATRAEVWSGEVGRDEDFEELKEGWEFETIGAGDVERLIAMVKDVGNNVGDS